MAEPVNPQRRDTTTRTVRWQSRIAAETNAAPNATDSQLSGQRTTLLSINNASVSADLVRRRLEQLAKLKSPALCSLVSVDSTAGGLSLTHECPHGSVSLAELIDSGSTLTISQVAEVGRAVCDGALTLHAVGMAHGGISLDNIVVSPEGSVLLTATGSAWGELPESTEAGVARDVVDVVALMAALTKDIPLPAPLARALLAMTKAQGVPSLDDLRSALGEVTGNGSLRGLLAEGRAPSPAEPNADADVPAEWGLQSPAAHRPSAQPQVPVGRRTSSKVGKQPLRRRLTELGDRLPSGRWLIGGAAGFVAAVAVLVTSTGGSDHEVAAAAEASPPARSASPSVSTTSVPRPTASSTPVAVTPPAGVKPVDRWKSVLAELDRTRSSAFALADSSLLAKVDAPDSPALKRDNELIAVFAERGVRAKDFTLPVQQVDIVKETADRAVLDVIDIRPAYSVVSADDGALVEPRPTRGPRRWRVSLLQLGERWLISDVTT